MFSDSGSRMVLDPFKEEATAGPDANNGVDELADRVLSMKISSDPTTSNGGVLPSHPLSRATAARETVFDISGGERASLGRGTAKTVLKPLKKRENSYRRICFSNKSFGNKAAKVAAPILASLKDRLVELDISDFIAGRPETQALKAMRIFSSALEGCVLRYLDLSDNALGEKGVRAFESLLKSQKDLRELHLRNDGISGEAAKAICELLPGTKRLQVLDFYNNMMGDEGVVAVSEIVRKAAPALEYFRCSSTRVGYEGGVALAEALAACTRMKKLDLEDNMFGTEAGLALSKAVAVFPDLTEVHLSHLNLEDEGAESLAYALHESAPSLEVLEMVGNDITARGAAPALAACVRAKRFLRKLNLSENELEDEGAILIGGALEEGHEQVVQVDLSSNSITTAGARVVAHAVVGKPRFKLLNINGNLISDEGIDEVKTIFEGCPEMLVLLDPEEEDDLE